MDELFLYDRDKGLFKEILKQSTVMEGRYHVSPNGGNDLNTSNLESYINDPASGLSTAKQKYPLCVCMTPKSRFVALNGHRWEEFTFQLFFITMTYTNADNSIKDMNVSTKTSKHHVWYDWKDMKEVAANFIEALAKVISMRTITINSVPVPLKMLVNIDKDNAVFHRHSKFNVDKISGASVSFMMYMDASMCSLNDYSEVNLNTDVTIPPADIHVLHKQ